MKIGAIFATALAASLLTSGTVVLAAGEGQGVVVTVNDYPITSLDVDQRLKLNEILGGGKGSPDEQRKRALQALIDDVIKMSEAKKYKADLIPPALIIARYFAKEQAAIDELQAAQDALS